MEVIIIAPTYETEKQREINADGRYRIFNESKKMFVGDYLTIDQAIESGRQAGASIVAKATRVGDYTEYSQVVYLGNQIDIKV